MIGGLFIRHPEGTPQGTVTFVDRNHPATRGMPESVSRVDEWYYYDRAPNARILATFDPKSIGQTDPGPNPISWAHEFEGGRVFYTGLGHTEESYAEPLFLNHIAGGLRWVLHDED
jgi:type 1 glutamine amidotransferase